MRLPTRAPVSCASPARRASCATGLALLALTSCSGPALATHYVVDRNGGGDFTTIQAAVAAYRGSPRDTILIMPGDYDEEVGGTFPGWSVCILGVEGPSTTRARSVGVFDGAQVRVEGLAFTAEVMVQRITSNLSFARCAFLGRVVAWSEGGPACFADCDFYGPTDFAGFTYQPPFRRLRFHGAPLRTHNAGSGTSQFEDCSFEGPADVLVEVYNLDDPDAFNRCRFANAATGLLCGFESGYGTLHVASCTFENLSVAGVRLADERGDFIGAEAGINVVGSRFERCGTAVRWMAPGKSKQGGPYLSGDTILASTGNGVEIGRFESLVAGTIIDGSGGHGIAYYQTDTTGTDDVDEHSNALVMDCQITNNGGDGVFIEDAGAPVGYRAPSAREVVDCWLAYNGGTGARITSMRWRVSGCRAYSNGGDGIACMTTFPGLPSLAYSNTSSFNQGSGLQITGPPPPGDSLRFVHHNLATMNGREGFRVPHHSFGSFAFNDAWGNYLTQYVGAWGSLDSNLTVDPRFCDLSAGDVGLQQGSPCGAGGVYGQIGARPESCPSTAAVEPGPAGATSFTLRPSVARGQVEFVPPTAGADGRVELYDLAGRLVWRAALGPATGVVRWHGEGGRGRAAAGLYWARFTRGAERTTRRLVWLE